LEKLFKSDSEAEAIEAMALLEEPEEEKEEEEEVEQPVADVLETLAPGRRMIMTYMKGSTPGEPREVIFHSLHTRADKLFMKAYNCRDDIYKDFEVEEISGVDLFDESESVETPPEPSRVLAQPILQGFAPYAEAVQRRRAMGNVEANTEGTEVVVEAKGTEGTEVVVEAKGNVEANTEDTDVVEAKGNVEAKSTEGDEKEFADLMTKDIDELRELKSRARSNMNNKKGGSSRTPADEATVNAAEARYRLLQKVCEEKTKLEAKGIGDKLQAGIGHSKKASNYLKLAKKELKKERKLLKSAASSANDFLGCLS